VCATPLLPRLLRRRDEVASRVPVFGEAATLDDAQAVVRVAGVDGAVLGFLPTPEQMATLSAERLSGPDEVERRTGPFRIGVIALQGDYRLHLGELAREARAAVDVVPVRSIAGLEACNAAVMPGGWSTHQSVLLQQSG